MRRVIVVIGFTCIALGAFAQRGFDFGLNLGTTQNHLSSILPIPDPGFKYAFGGYYRHSINQRFSWRTGVNAGMDVNNSLKIFDGYGLMEFYFQNQEAMEGGRKIVPYISTGFSYLIDLNEQKTIKDLNYKKVQYYLRNIVIPFNVGIRYNPTSKITVCLEWAFRKRIQMDFKAVPPEYTPLQTNWRSYFSVTVGALFSNYCRTCPFYENLRKQR